MELEKEVIEQFRSGSEADCGISRKLKREKRPGNGPKRGGGGAGGRCYKLAPGALPGPPQMVVMMHARNGPMAHQRGSSGNANKSGKAGHRAQR